MKLFTDKLKTFPSPRDTMDEGILDLSDDLSVDRLLEAYSFGIFPWPFQDLPTVWYSPERRGVVDFADWHVPKSLRKFEAKSGFSYSMNRAFDQVILGCAESPRPGQSGTWITSKLVNAYKAFHKAGYAHSLEVWKEDRLVGGLYGVYVAGVFCGESMFFREDNASKCALVRMVDFLQEQGLQWMDIQMVTPLLENFGGKYISRDEFLNRLEQCKKTAQAIEFKM